MLIHQKLFALLILNSGIASGAFAQSVNKINGEIPLGRAAVLENIIVMLDTINADGKQLFVSQGVRKAGTRAHIHIHKYGGHTCVLSGEITDFIEGRKPTVYRAGTCYYMPPSVPMTAANLGTEDAVLIDTFIVPIGAEKITIIEED